MIFRLLSFSWNSIKLADIPSLRYIHRLPSTSLHVSANLHIKLCLSLTVSYRNEIFRFKKYMKSYGKNRKIKKKRTDLSYFSPVVLVFNEWKRNLTLHHSTCTRRKYENINYGINIHSLPITVSSPVLYVFFNNPVIYINPQYRSNRRVMYVATLTFPAGLREEVERFPVSSVRSTLRCLFPLWNELLYYSFFVSYLFLFFRLFTLIRLHQVLCVVDRIKMFRNYFLTLHFPSSSTTSVILWLFFQLYFI